MADTPRGTKPSDYLHIRAWGRRLLSFEYYICNQQEKAFDGGQPVDVIYERYASDGSGPTGEWARIGDCSQSVREGVESDVEYLRSQNV